MIPNLDYKAVGTGVLDCPQINKIHAICVDFSCFIKDLAEDFLFLSVGDSLL